MASKARKTVDVATVKMMANNQLRRTDITTEARKAIADFIEAVLFEANAYQGFNDIYWAREGGFEAWRAAGSPEGAEKNQYIHGGDGTDVCRRFYY
jgi:hypothetical protein